MSEDKPKPIRMAWLAELIMEYITDTLDNETTMSGVSNGFRYKITLERVEDLDVENKDSLTEGENHE